MTQGETAKRCCASKSESIMESWETCWSLKFHFKVLSIRQSEVAMATERKIKPSPYLYIYIQVVRLPQTTYRRNKQTLTWPLRRSWQRGRRVRPCWNFQTCPGRAVRWFWKKCWVLPGPDSSSPHPLRSGCAGSSTQPPAGYDLFRTHTLLHEIWPSERCWHHSALTCKHMDETNTFVHTATHTLGKEFIPAGQCFCLDTTWLLPRVTAHL